MASAKAKKKNPRLASGRKRARQDVKLNAANTSLRSKYRTAVKNVEKAVAAGDKAKATELFAKARAIVDIVADKGIFHKNKAARDKSRLSAKVKALAQPPPDVSGNSPRSARPAPFETGALQSKKAAFGRFWRCAAAGWACRATGRPRPPAGRCPARSSARSPRPWARGCAIRC